MKQELKWIITNDFGDKEPHCLSVRAEDGFYEAFIKNNGCCEITEFERYNPETDENETEEFTIHICDIPRFITMLQSLEDFRMNNIESAE